MAYVDLDDMEARIPPGVLLNALDDDDDGQPDDGLWAKIQQAVGEKIDGCLGVRFAVPFNPPLPAVVVSAAQIFAAEMVYDRKGFSGEERNPWAGRAARMMAKLEKIADGLLPLAPGMERARPSVSVITERAKTHSSRDNLIL